MHEVEARAERSVKILSRHERRGNLETVTHPLLEQEVEILARRERRAPQERRDP